ncbi:oxidoreductase [Nisaea acidiphila]|uniref:Oxidoreductase n=1 Tax=Nisaea acidiphila TaxID=1862145 RepID=A0A9J7B0R4_9PROT|nr:MDR family oxidoreductase [Nisaea acidiphila]UUX51277.1 oxidoreductase [Nisaea acidiphila]
MSETFKAVLLREADKKVSAAIEQVPVADLPEGDVTVRVAYTTLNYKDGMVMNGIGRLVRDYPHIPGVDFSGIVESSEHPDYQPGDKVVLTGWRVGEVHWGGYGELARVKGDWLVKLPEGIGLDDAMAIGTAGFTAMLSVDTLERHGLEKDRGDVLVTGAAGGVGSVATAILANLGYSVAGSTGRPEQADYLMDLGVSQVIDRAELAQAPSRPLAGERFAGCIDNVAGTTLSNVLTQMKYGSAVAAVGLAGGNELNTTVLPFLLRGVSILGIDSVICPKERRLAIWKRIATDLPMQKLHHMIERHTLEDLPNLGKKILEGGVRGRTVIEVSGS